MPKASEYRSGDEKVTLRHLVGANRQFIESYIPHVGNLVRDQVDTVVTTQAEVVVLCTNELSAIDIMEQLCLDQYLIDVVIVEKPSNRVHHFGNARTP